MNSYVAVKTKIKLNQISTLQMYSLTGALSPGQPAFSADVFAVMYCLERDNLLWCHRCWWHQRTIIFRLLVSLVASRLSHTGLDSRPLSMFSFGFNVLMWIASKIFLGKSLGSFSNTLTLSQSIICPLLRSTCSRMADFELTALDLGSASLFSNFRPDSPK